MMDWQLLYAHTYKPTRETPLARVSPDLSSPSPAAPPMPMVNSWPIASSWPVPSRPKMDPHAGRYSVVVRECPDQCSNLTGYEKSPDESQPERSEGSASVCFQQETADASLSTISPLN